MEVFNALAVLIEPPTDVKVMRIGKLLGMSRFPTLSEYTETFVFQFNPYASVYLGAEGMFGGEARDRIAGFWRALGRTPPAEPDHLTILLATYARLSSAENAITAFSPSKNSSSVEDSALHTNLIENVRRHEALRSARTAFLWEHLLSWLPGYLDRVAEVAPQFYRRWAELLTNALLEEAGTVRPPAFLPLHLREAPNIADPRATTPDEFLQTIFAPVRSGLILVRSDLACAASSLGTALRAGERKYALKSLLGQDARGTLAWLACEASRQAERHARHRDNLGAVADWWSARAAATGKLLRDLESDVADLP